MSYTLWLTSTATTTISLAMLSLQFFGTKSFLQLMKSLYSHIVLTLAACIAFYAFIGAGIMTSYGVDVVNQLLTDGKTKSDAFEQVKAFLQTRPMVL